MTTKIILTNKGIKSYNDFISENLKNKDFNTNSINKHLSDIEFCIDNIRDKAFNIRIENLKNKSENSKEIDNCLNRIKSLDYYRDNIYSNITKEIKCFKTLGQIWFYLNNINEELAAKWSADTLKDYRIYLNIDFTDLKDYILLEQKLFYLNKNNVKLIMFSEDKDYYGKKSFKEVDAALIRREVDKKIPKINNKDKSKSPIKIINFDTPISKNEYNIKFKLLPTISNNNNGKVILPIKVENFEDAYFFSIGTKYLGYQGTKLCTTNKIDNLITNTKGNDIQMISLENYNHYYFKVNNYYNNLYLNISKTKPDDCYFTVDSNYNLKCAVTTKVTKFDHYDYNAQKSIYRDVYVTNEYYAVAEVNSKINKKGLTSLLKSIKSIVREYSDQEYYKYYKFVGDYKTKSNEDEADGYNIRSYKHFNDLNLIVNFNLEGVRVDFDMLRSKLKGYKNLQYAINSNIAYSKYTPDEKELYKYSYRTVPMYNDTELTVEQKATVIKKYGTLNVPKLKLTKELISTISTNDVIKNLYVKYFNVSEYDEDEFFIKLIKKAYEEKNDEVIKDFMSFSLQYEDFRIDMETLGFQTEEINYIGQVLMEDLRFVDQFEMFYEDAEAEDEVEDEE